MDYEIEQLELKLKRKNNALWRCLRMVDLLSDDELSVIDPNDTVFNAWLALMRQLILSELDK